VDGQLLAGAAAAASTEEVGGDAGLGKGADRPPLAGTLLVIVGVVGCAALVGGTANEIDKGIQKEQNSNAITNKQARSVKLGTTRGAVESKFGPPKSDQESTNEGLGDDTCIYYNVKGGEILDQWQFCFGGAGKSGKLTTKNRL